MKTKGEDKVVEVDINEIEIGKEIEYEGDKISLKQGTKVGDTFIIKGKGYEGKSGGKNGDLIYIVKNIKKHKNIIRKRKNSISLIILLISLIEGISYVFIKNIGGSSQEQIIFSLAEGLGRGLPTFALTMIVFYILYLTSGDKKEGLKLGFITSLFFNILFYAFILSQ